MNIFLAFLVGVACNIIINLLFFGRVSSVEAKFRCNILEKKLAIQNLQELKLLEALMMVCSQHYENQKSEGLTEAFNLVKAAGLVDEKIHRLAYKWGSMHERLVNARKILEAQS